MKTFWGTHSWFNADIGEGNVTIGDNPDKISGGTYAETY
jgi:hypothetical protein